ncbi:hypothetical protein SZN_24378, partial [Streptomyces zinciresistens K42]
MGRGRVRRCGVGRRALRGEMGGEFTDRAVLEEECGGQRQAEFALQAAREVDGGQRVQAERQEGFVVADLPGCAVQRLGQQTAYQAGHGVRGAVGGAGRAGGRGREAVGSR